MEPRSSRPAAVLAALAAALAAAGCKSESANAGPPATRLTAGEVQRKIRIGMPSAEVAEALGSPNIVSTDEQGREVWVYERFAREVTARGSWLFFVIAGGESSSATQSERSLTVIIKYDGEGRVRDFAYHSTSF